MANSSQVLISHVLAHVHAARIIHCRKEDKMSLKDSKACEVCFSPAEQQIIIKLDEEFKLLFIKKGNMSQSTRPRRRHGRKYLTFLQQMRIIQPHVKNKNS